uniref:RRM domain-containing protein n=1 Tax=Panagrolaimus superbus TaxID=310955 RepID=A0A914Z4Z2_9BILA
MLFPFLALSEQGVDINSYLFSSASDTNTTAPTTTTSMETENNDGIAAAAAAVVAASKNETGKNKEEEKQKEEVVQENVEKTIEIQATTENKSNENLFTPFTADDLIEKVEDEAELQGESENIIKKPAVVNGNGNRNEDGSPDIGDLEEREESEGDDGKNESNSMETDAEKKAEQQKQQISAIHEISDEEELDEEEMLTGDTSNQKIEKKEDEKLISDVKTESGDTDVKQETESSNKETKLPAKPRIPAGLNFPSDDPNGLRCIWIRAIPTETRLSELKLAFIDAGFTVENAKIFTTKQSSRPSAFGFMTLSSQDGAKNAVAKMNNSIFKGKVITVERACDASMLASSDLIPSSTSSSDVKKAHPPIKPPEDVKAVVSESGRSRIISNSKSSRTHDNCKTETVLTIFSTENTKSNLSVARSRTERHRSPYMNTVNRSRILRTEPQRIVEASGRSIRVVASRDSGGSSRSSRPSRHSPIRPLHRERERTPPRRHHRSPDRERIAEQERRKYEDMMRKKEEEFRRKEEALRIEAERNRIKLEKERLEKENLELKLRLQQEQLRATTNVSSSRRGPSPHSTTRHRGNTPPRRSSPPRSSRHVASPRHSSRRTPEPRHHTSSSYRQEPPPKEAYPVRRRSRSRSPVRTAYDRSRPNEYSSRGSRPQEHGSSRHSRPESPLRNVPPPTAKYERHSPRRNYESSRSDRSRRNDKIDTAYPTIEEPQRSSRSSRNGGGGGGTGRDFPSNNYDRPSNGNGNSSFGSARRESGNHFIPPPPANIPVTTYNLTTDYRTAGVNPSYSTTPGNSRNQIPATNTWPQQNFPTPNQQPQNWAHQPQNIANIPQWNPFNSSGGAGMRSNNSNQRYGGF